MDQFFIAPQTWIHPWAHPPSENPGYMHATTTWIKINATIAATSFIYIQLSYIGLYAGHMVMIELGINLICSR